MKLMDATIHDHHHIHHHQYAQNVLCDITVIE